MQRLRLLALTAVASSSAFAPRAAAPLRPRAGARAFSGTTAKRVSEVSIGEAYQLVELGTTRFVDCRTTGEVAQSGAIAGAVCAVSHDKSMGGMDPRPDEFVAEVQAAGVGLDEDIVVCCAAGIRSIPAAMWLEEAGYKDVKSLESGMYGWAAAGLPVGPHA